MSTARTRVVVDCDPGLDDVVALAVLAADAAAGRIEIGALFAVAGNVDRDRCLANAEVAVRRLGLAVPVRPGAAGPLGGVDAVDAGGFHGGDGLAGLAEHYGAVPAPVAPTEAGPAVAEAVRSVAGSGTADVLTLGPLTDLALALEADPDLIDRIGRVVSMGGAFGTPTPDVAGSLSAKGNVTDRSEFNIHADPLAADRVFAAGLDLTLVPLDVTRRVQLTEADAARAAEAGADELVVDLLRAGVDRQRAMTGLEGMAAHDPLAALVLVEPDVVGVERRAVSVAVDGADRGVCEEATDGRAPIAVALDVDVARAHAGLLERLGPVPT
ncbi:MAG: nucleoside hydrolase [Actinomycetota bacterium]